MKKPFIIWSIFTLTFFAGLFIFFVTQKKINYFETVPQEQISKSLHQFKVKTCKEFLQTYIETKKDTKTLVHPMAYDIGLCVEQDLKKARDLYEEIFQKDPGSLNFFIVRLAMIYKFGPAELKNSKRAKFLFKQAAIYWATLKDPLLRRQGMHNIVNNEKLLPKQIEKELLWLEDLFRKTPEERKKIALDLKNKGFHETDYLWDSLYQHQTPPQ